MVNSEAVSHVSAYESFMRLDEQIPSKCFCVRLLLFDMEDEADFAS